MEYRAIFERPWVVAVTLRDFLPNFIGVPPGVKVDLTLDQSIYIRQSISSLWHEASQGAVLAFLVILASLLGHFADSDYKGVAV